MQEQISALHTEYGSQLDAGQWFRR